MKGECKLVTVIGRTTRTLVRITQRAGRPGDEVVRDRWLDAAEAMAEWSRLWERSHSRDPRRSAVLRHRCRLLAGVLAALPLPLTLTRSAVPAAVRA